MPEQLAARVLKPLHRMTLSMVCALPLYGIPAGVFAQSVPAGLRACTTESDPGRRLACYDKEMARSSPSSAQRAVGPTAAESNHSSTPAPARLTAGPTSTTSKAAGGATSPPHRAAPLWKIFAGGASSRLTARLASLERWPDAMVLHLDNGQVWQEIGHTSGDLSLRAGDSVTIERHLGSYWLSSRYVSNMQVRLKPQ